jgi:hypothetical protein
MEFSFFAVSPPVLKEGVPHRYLAQRTLRAVIMTKTQQASNKYYNEEPVTSITSYHD